MAGYTQAYQQTVLDLVHPTTGNGQHVMYSTDGTTETARIARTAIGATGWAAATAATPSVKANSAVLSTAAVSAGANITVTHFAVITLSAAGVQITDWQTLTASKTLAAGETATWAVGDLRITLD